MKKYTPIIIIVALLLVGMVFYNFVSNKLAKGTAEKFMEKNLERVTGNKVDVKVGQSEDEVEYTFKSEDGSMTVSSKSELPDDFPSDIPIYSNCEVKGSMKISKDDRMTVTFECSDELKNILDFYKREFPEMGWTVSSAYDLEDGGMVSADKGEASTNIIVSKDDDTGKANMVLSYGEDRGSYSEEE